MPQTVPLSLRISPEKARRLDALAKTTERKRSWILEKALDAYLEDQAWQIARIEKGLTELKAGESVAHDDIAAWLDTWGGDAEGEPPE